MSTAEPADKLEPTGTQNRYDDYEDSEVEWLGEIPVHWDVVRAEAFLNRKSESVSSENLDGREVFHYSIPVIDETGDGRVEEGNKIGSSKTRLSGGELLVSKLNPRKSRVLLSEDKSQLSVCSSEFVVMEPDGCDPRFAKYLYSAEHTRQYLDSMVQSATRSHQRANPDDIIKMKAGWPPLDEQHAIATYLDRETERIDALIEKKEQLIDLLEEKRTSLISRAVTKGLEEDVEMKDSGVEWLGKVPAHWETAKLKFLSPKITVGIVVKPRQHYEPDGIPALRSLNVTEHGLNSNDLVFISEEVNEELEKSRVWKGDLVSVRTGQPGTTAVVGSRFHGANCIDLIIIRRSEAFESNYLSYFLNSSPAKTQYGAGSEGAIQQHFNVDTAKNLKVPVPPMGEQDQIAKSLHHRTTQLNRLISKVGEGIESLQEYRTALISVAVTGQIDVREEVDTPTTAA
jgi:type I restriction enzyme S subunit